MLISDTRKKNINFLKLLRIGVLTLVAGLAMFLFVYPLFLKFSTQYDPTIIHCDAERTYRKSFISNGRRFSNAETQSADFAHTGDYSSKLPEAESPQYGWSYEFLNITPGTTYEASVWVKKMGVGSAFLVFTGPEGSSFYKASDVLGTTENGFSKISLTVQVPSQLSPNKAKVYVYTDGRARTYFDDLKIIETDQVAQPDPYQFDPPQLDLQLKDKSYRKLKDKTKEALAKGVLITDEDSWVNATLKTGQEKIPVKIRLKGDWLDHVENDKWSFRIKTKEAQTWNRMKTFSVHTPAARYYALEWLLHQFWEREDILTTRYDFLNLSINGKPLGTYAFEEHFEKQLLEYRQRREGPIVRFSESALWQARSRDINSRTKDRNALPESALQSSATIQPFTENKISASPALSEQYAIAQNLLFQYQQGLKLAEDIFDLDQLAKYTAIIDLFGAHHSIIWHNQRFYYNPVTSLLEPIGYDGFASQPWSEALILGKELLEHHSSTEDAPLKKLYNDVAFLEKYMHYLLQFTDEDYLQSFFNETAQGMKDRVDFLKTEFPKFNYSRQRILDRASQIRFKLYPFEQYSVQANWLSKSPENSILEITNLHEFPLQIVGTSSKAESLDYPLEKALLLPNFKLGNPNPKSTLQVLPTSTYVFYQPFGVDTLYTSRINQFPKPKDAVPRQLLFTSKKITSNELYDVQGKDVLFKKGNYQSSRDIIIPAGYQVIFEAGVSLDLIQKAKFISRSPVDCRGTSDDWIQIYSSDQTANGFTILQAASSSKLNFTRFTNLNTLAYQGWNLTGAVTFYESEVELQQVQIFDNHCEDALNIIRSNFDIKYLELRNPAFDGFDADFCTGKIAHSTITNPGNDGLDFSGSTISINACQINQAGDKGISVGEASRITVDNTTIDGAVIGTASKDLSYLLIKGIVLKNCTQGFAAYQKKPEYGRSAIFVENYQTENIKYLHTIAPRCTLKINGYFVIGE